MKNLTGIYWIKNEARYIPEYVEFHLLQGFDHFIFYDNKSDDNLLEVIKPYIDSGIVEIRYYPSHVINRNNFWLMEHTIHEQKNKSKWVHYHALDERLFCPNGQNLVEFLSEYENYGGVCVAWKMFNSNGHVTRPKGLVIENYTQTVEDPQFHIKTIIQPNKTLTHAGNPHQFAYYYNSRAVDENKIPVNSPFNPFGYSMNKIKLHHYVTMSREEFDIKMNKGILDHAGQENGRRNTADSQWDFMERTGIKGYDDTLLKYVDIVREKILERYKDSKHLLQYINH